MSRTDPRPSDPEAIQADIERTREELAATVDELGARLSHGKAEAKTWGVRIGAVAGVGVVALVVLKVVKKRRAA